MTDEAGRTRLIILANNAVEEFSATLAGASKPDENQQEETMRRFNVHFVTDIDFVDGDKVGGWRSHLCRS